MIFFHLLCNQMQSVCLGLFSLLMNQIKILAAKRLRPSKAQHYDLSAFIGPKVFVPIIFTGAKQ